MRTFLQQKFSILFERIFLSSLLYCLIVLALFLNVTYTNHQHFVYLADSFTHGTLAFRELVVYKDVAPFEGEYYWHLGPFPAVLLMPFVALFGTGFLEGYINIILTALNFYLVYWIALHLGVRRKIHAVWLATGFIFGSAYLEIALNSNAWRFAQAVSTSLILLALYEYFTYKRMWLIGILLALITATRPHLILGGIFFMLPLLWEKHHWRYVLQQCIQVALPIGIVILLLASYNYARFGNVVETGYSLGPGFNALFEGKHSLYYGLEYSGGKVFSPDYIPSNLYFYFLRSLDRVSMGAESYIVKPPFLARDQYGVGFLISCTLFLLAFAAHAKERLVQQAWIAVISISVPIFFFFGPTQRYAVDVLPFLFIPLVYTIAPEVQLPVKLLILFGIVVNCAIMFASLTLI